MSLTMRAHASDSYPPRTFDNAGRADLTAAFAFDFATAGEKLTKKAAGPAYVALDLALPAVENARLLFAALRATRVARPTLNIAGNGVYTLVERGWDQARADGYVLDVLRTVHTHWPLGQIVSGGQTGIDWAGGVAGRVLDLPVDMLFPAGFRQRDERAELAGQHPGLVRDRFLASVRALKGA